MISTSTPTPTPALNPNSKPMSCPAQILKHDWLVKEGVAYDISLDSVVLKRMKQFAQVR